MVMKRDTLMQNPDREFQDPRRLLEDQELTDKQKVQLLMNWRLDLLELERATEENMASAKDTGKVAEKMKKVNDALGALGASPRSGTPL